MAIMSYGEIHNPEESTPTDKLVIDSIAARCLHTSYMMLMTEIRLMKAGTASCLCPEKGDVVEINVPHGIQSFKE